MIFRLYFIHFSAALAIWLATYWPDLDLFLSLVYLAVVWTETKAAAKMQTGTFWVRLLIWQGPGALLALASVFPWWWYGGLKEYAFFGLEFWYTPVLPLFSLFNWGWNDYPLYYYALLVMPLFFGGAFWLACKSQSKLQMNSTAG